MECVSRAYKGAWYRCSHGDVAGIEHHLAASMRTVLDGDGGGCKRVPRARIYTLAGSKEHGVDSLGVLPEKAVNLDSMEGWAQHSGLY